MSTVKKFRAELKVAHLTKFRRKEQWWGWAMAAPALILGFIFLILPFFMAIFYSFTNQRLISNPNLPTKFIGLSNYQGLLEDADFWHSLQNTATFVVIVVPVQLSLALLLALLVNRKAKYINFFRATFFVPVVMPMVVVATIWAFLYAYDQTGQNQGLVNSFIHFFSGSTLGPYWWTGDPNVALLAIIILSIWQGVGFQMVIFLAGLQEIPQEMYEAADIDGASKGQLFWFVTLPLLKNTIIFVVLTTTILAFGLFDQVNILTQGGPLGATNTLTYFMITKGFNELKVGYGSAIAVVFFIIVVIISLILRRFMREERAIQE